MKVKFLLLFLSLMFFQEAKSDDGCTIISVFNDNEDASDVMRFNYDGDTIYTVGKLTRKYILCDNMLQKLYSRGNKSLGTSYSGRDVKIKGDYVYVAGRANGYGNLYEKKPLVSMTFENSICDDQAEDTFTKLIHSDGIVSNNYGAPAPNLGFHSLSLSANSKTRIDQPLVYKKSISDTRVSYINFWIKINSLNDIVKIPILGYDEQTIYYITLKLSPNRKNISLGVCEEEVIYENETDIQENEWYNIKIKVDEGSLALWYRPKECGSWKNVISETDITNKLVNSLEIGMATNDQTASVNIDDIYYSNSDIDKCSYINGALSIYKKEDMSIIDTYNLELRCNSMAIYDNLLCVSCLRSINFYDISDPSKPQLIHSYRKDQWWEAQGSDIYETNGNVYLFVTCYTFGNAIFNITDPNNIHLVKELSISDLADYTQSNKNYTFDVVVDYPYAYCTFCVSRLYQDSESDHRGVLTIDLSDIDNIKTRLDEYPSSYYPKTTTDGDTKPCQITKCGSNLILNNGIMGITHFSVSDRKQPVFVSCHDINDHSCVMAVKGLTDSLLLVGDANSGDDAYPNKNIYLLKIGNNNISTDNKTLRMNNQKLDYYMSNGIKIKNSDGVKRPTKMKGNVQIIF